MSQKIIGLSLLISISALAAMLMASVVQADDRTGIYVAIAAAPELSKFTAILEAGGLARGLQGPGPYTVFAPSNAALDALPEGYLEALVDNENRVGILALLTRHVVLERLETADIVGGQTVEALDGYELSFVVDDQEIRVEGAKIIKPDINNRAGVVHIINQVMVPEPWP